MEQPYVIAQKADSSMYLAISFKKSWEQAKVATWVRPGAWRDEVLTFEDLREAKDFAASVREKTGIEVEVVMKWEESIEEILHAVGVASLKSHDATALREGLVRLWEMLDRYPARSRNKVT